MSKALSLDLRERVVAAVCGGMSRRCVFHGMVSADFRGS